MKKILCAAVAATALLSAPAAANTFPGMTISKGDIQTAFGWNNAAYQASHDAIAFALQQVASYSGTCTATVTTEYEEHFQDKGKGKWHTRTVTSTVSIPGTFSSTVPLNANVATELVLNGKKTVAHVIGISLGAASVSDSSAPQNGGACQVADEEGTMHTGVLSGVSASLSTASVVGSVLGAADYTFWTQTVAQ